MRDSNIRPFLNRRGLLKLGAGVVGAAVVAGALGVRSLVKDRDVGSGRAVFDDDEAAVIAALADAWFPSSADGGNVIGVAAKDVDVVAGVDAYAGRLLPRERKLLRILMRAVEQWPRLSLTSPSSFSSLALADRQRVLQAFETSSLAERRLLATLLRSLIGMPLFDDPRFLAAIAHRHGCGLPVVQDAP